MDDTHGTCSSVKKGVRLSNQGSHLDGYSDIALTLLARDYKGFGNQQMTGVLELSKEDHKAYEGKDYGKSTSKKTHP